MHLVIGMEGSIELGDITGDGLDEGAVLPRGAAYDRLDARAVERHTGGVLWAAKGRGKASATLLPAGVASTYGCLSRRQARCMGKSRNGYGNLEDVKPEKRWRWD